MLVEKLVFGGQGLGHEDDRAVFVWNGLPGEEVEVRYTKRKKNFAEGIVSTVKKAAPERIAPKEDHWLSCSPWQILEYSAELAWKQALSAETYRGIGKLTDITTVPISSTPTEFGYRNKMEFSFYEGDRGGMSLAFHQRGTHFRKPIDTCLLATTPIQEVAAAVVTWANKLKFTRNDIKTIIVRSTSDGKTAVAIFLKTEKNVPPPRLPSHTVGWEIYYSEPRSPASVPTKLLQSWGNVTLTEQVLGTPLQHALQGFFQVNIPVFEQAVTRIGEWLEPNSAVVDFYSGVGAISISLRDKIATAILVENNAEATEFAQKNIAANNCTDTFQAVCESSQNMLATITSDKTIIVDPPRAGLEPDVVARLLEVQPKRIIYLSCNVSTQARDIQLLSAAYTLRHVELFNFFPRTPHVEALCVLDASHRS